MAINVLMVLTDGFEEIEAAAPVDILRRAGIKVSIAALDFKLVSSARNMMIKSDTLIDLIPDPDIFDMLLIPGGEPGVTNLEEDGRVIPLIKRFNKNEKWIAAICAAPRLLAKAGVLKGKKATSHPSNEDKLAGSSYQKESVVVDGKIITSRGPGTAMAFGYKLVEVLKSAEISEDLKDKMVYQA